MSKEGYIERLRQAVLNYDEEAAKESAEEALKAGVDPVEAIERGLAAGIREVGEKFHRGEVFLPHVVLAADAMTAATGVLEPAIPKDRGFKRVTIVLGTVEGDIHDIGKNVVAMMMKAAGFNVQDLGKDVKIDVFIEKAKEVNADIIGVSSLMTTTMPYQRELIRELERLGLRERFKVMVGGGPVTREWAENIGADGYGRDAKEAVESAKQLLGIKSEG